MPRSHAMIMPEDDRSYFDTDEQIYWDFDNDTAGESETFELLDDGEDENDLGDDEDDS